jgi:hypothetical protein
MTFILPGGVGQLFAKTAVPPSAWNPASVYVTSPPATFYTNNRTIVGGLPGTGAHVNDCKGTLVRSTGKYYFEVQIPAIDPTVRTQSIGVVSSAWVASGIPIGNDASGYGFGAQNTASFWQSFNANGAYASGVTAPANYDIIGVAVDFTTASQTNVYYHLNGIWSLGGGPAGNTPTFIPAQPDFTYYVATPVFPATSATNISGAAGGNILNIGNAAFGFAPPAGFVAWG